MALKDMKSDLSKFRMPKSTPLESKERVDVNKNLNKTPLSGLVKDVPVKTSLSPTAAKTGVNPQKVNQSEKFKGETTPQPMDNSSKFKGETTPKPMSLEERYLGQTDPTMVNQSEKFKGETTPKEVNQSEKFKGETTPKEMNNSENFLGETTPKEMNNSENFLGETTPKEANNSEQFLGETSPKEMNNSEQFLGETSPKESDKSSKFLGETTPTEMNPQTGEKFLGETTPNESDRSSKFLGETTPNEMNNQSQFLGETTPNESDRSSKFLGETTQKPMDNSENFLGETTPVESDRSSKFLGETTPNLMNIPNGERGLGETSPIPMNIPNGENALGETTPNDFSFKKKLENEGKDFKEVNNLLDIHATGFNSKFGGVEATKFIGVNPNNTVFDGATSLFSNINDNTFTLGKTYGTSFNDAGGMNSGEEGFGIGKGQAKRQSPSFLDEQYNKFNLRDDAFNLGTAAFAHPLILRGIQRKGITKGEPQRWGFGIPLDDGLMRGGIVTAVERSLIDGIRLGKWMISVNGLLWGIKNLGLQASNSNVETVTGKRLTKVWTPVNTLASAVGGFLGLHPRRHGILPLPEAANPEKYETVQKAKKVAQVDDVSLGVVGMGNRLVGLYNESFLTMGSMSTSSTFKGTPFLRLQAPGGPNSVYGLIPGGKIPTRGEDTRFDVFDGFTIQNQYKPVGTDPSSGPSAEANFGMPFDESTTSLAKEIKDTTDEYKPIFSPEGPNKGNDDTTANGKAGRIYNDEETYPTLETDREEISGIGLEDVYTSIKDGNELDETNEIHKKYDNPFEKLKNTDGESHNIEKLESSELIKGYETIAYGKMPERVAGDTEVNDFRSLLDGDGKKRASKADYTGNSLQSKFGFTNPGKVGADRTDYTTSHAADPIQSGAINAAEHPDLVKLIFDRHGGGSKLQFRGTVGGLTETFSPSWEGMKYNGRADSAFKYSTFERSLSFNFKVYPTSKAELKPLYSKLQRLSTMTMPNYGDGTKGYEGILLDFTLGNLWVKHLSFIDSLSYTFSDDVPWDIDEGASMGIDVSIGLKLLSNVIPEYNSKVYDLGGI